MKTSIRRMGNSHGVLIPKPLLEEAGVNADDPVDIRVRKGKIVIAPIGAHPRAEWVAESKAIHAAGDDRLVWPETFREAEKDATP